MDTIEKFLPRFIEIDSLESNIETFFDAEIHLDTKLFYFRLKLLRLYHLQIGLYRRSIGDREDIVDIG